MYTTTKQELIVDNNSCYKDVFDLIGRRPNETIEDLYKLLPGARLGIKSFPTEELETRDDPEHLLKKLMKGLEPIAENPLRREWRLAGEQEAEDVPEERGEWVDAADFFRVASARAAVPYEKADEEVDSDGVPVLRLRRASSGCVLDGPGDIRVDNFTLEGEQELDGVGAAVSPPCKPLEEAAKTTAVLVSILALDDDDLPASSSSLAHGRAVAPASEPQPQCGEEQCASAAPPRPSLCSSSLLVTAGACHEHQQLRPEDDQRQKPARDQEVTHPGSNPNSNPDLDVDYEEIDVPALREVQRAQRPCVPAFTRGVEGQRRSRAAMVTKESKGPIFTSHEKTSAIHVVQESGSGSGSVGARSKFSFSFGSKGLALKEDSKEQASGPPGRRPVATIAEPISSRVTCLEDMIPRRRPAAAAAEPVSEGRTSSSELSVAVAGAPGEEGAADGGPPEATYGPSDSAAEVVVGGEIAFQVGPNPPASKGRGRGVSEEDSEELPGTCSAHDLAEYQMWKQNCGGVEDDDEATAAPMAAAGGLTAGNDVNLAMHSNPALGVLAEVQMHTDQAKEVVGSVGEPAAATAGFSPSSAVPSPSSPAGSTEILLVPRGLGGGGANSRRGEGTAAAVVKCGVFEHESSEVEAFSLDPDFDYDNVNLTPREFPYTLLGHGKGGAMAAAAAAATHASS